MNEDEIMKFIETDSQDVFQNDIPDTKVFASGNKKKLRKAASKLHDRWITLFISKTSENKFKISYCLS